ncbi:ATP-binding cassette domain-containing protein [candidate division CSSED10-310 bacterium]|uniref:ATP-binding cassette domain-containing protein n=1 Tax=candidate division CSSED10-310 bacterium TaxID=2855610 RepID=A0ABV6YUT0_UNCC1
MDSIVVQNLTKKFGPFTAVDAINFRVKKGEIFGFLGANGAGKSTAIRMMCGLLEPTSGTAVVAGHDVSQKPEMVKQSIGYMSQRFSLYEDITVSENIRFFGGVYGLRGQKLIQRTDWVLDMARLRGQEKQITGTLPGGIKQRLALGCAFIHEPTIVFLDEPTGGVDPISRRQFWELIQQLADEGTTILVTTHFLDEAEYCHTIALINAGQIVAYGSPRHLKQNYLPYNIVGLEVDRPLAALALLQALPYVVEISLFGLSLHCGVTQVAETIPKIRQVLTSNGFRVSNLEPILPSLEDVFIYLIEKK